MTDLSYFSDTSNPAYSSFIHLSRYARWLPNEGRRETWEETIDRYINFFVDRFPEQASEIKELRQYLLSIKTLPSMRCLMTAGKALDKSEVAGYNCLRGDTKVVTKEYGVVPISSLAGKSVHVVDGNGSWVKSICHNFGEQSLQRVTFATSGKGSFYVDATANHRWILKNGDIKTTEELHAGDVCAVGRIPITTPVQDSDYYEGVKHGLVYGDGTSNYRVKQEKKLLKGFSVRLCSDVEDLLPYFEGCSVSYPPSFNGQPVVYLYGSDSAIDLKSLPDLKNPIFTDSYISGFARGWFAADGSVGKNGQCSIAATNEGVEWLYAASVRSGFVPRSYRKYPSKTNLGSRSESLFHVEFDRRYLTDDDVLIKRKRDRFKPVDSLKNPGCSKITSVEILNTVEPVYCFKVPTTQSFLLYRGILTGNCSFIAIDSPRTFDEILYVLLCGTGVGFSVERQYVNKLPEVAEEFHETDTTIVVRDSKIGWAAAFRELVSLLYMGQIPKWDVSKVRPAGARLKTFGGRASGPEPLEDLFRFSINLFKKAAGRRLSSVECHDLVCKVAEIVVVGGTRRAALLSLSNVSDDRMRLAKSGQWWLDNPQRQLANNSAAYTEKPEFEVFLNEWNSLYESKSGERGIFSRVAARKQVESTGRRDPDHEWGTNPCSEILLRSSGQMCNLSEVVARVGDTLEDLEDKVRVATILGTLQSTLTNFRYLRKIWKKNTEEERLLGVSITGIMDHDVLSGNEGDEKLINYLKHLRNVAIDTNKEWSEKLGIPQSTSITCVKPSGTASQVADTASGIHPRFSKYYIRRVRASKNDPLAMYMKDAGFPCEDDVLNPNVYVFSFPIKAPDAARVVKEVGAMEQLRLWSIYQEHWCDHKPSITVYYTNDEFLEVGNWVWNNFDKISGISFLPVSDHVYQQAPYEEIDEKKYEELKSKMPEVDWGGLAEYEEDDNTVGSQTYACSGDACEIVDLTS